MPDRVFGEASELPGQRDNLFVRGSDRRSRAFLSHSHMWDAYAMGYKLAADLLAEHVADNIVHRNLLGFPILFLYRQYLELRIKELGVVAAEFLGEKYAVPKDHKLVKLWQGVRPTLDMLFPKNTGDFEAVGKTIRDFADIDPRSYVFRYPVHTSGKPTLPAAPAYVQINSQGWPVGPPPQPGLKEVDVAHVKEIMGQIAALLDGCSTEIYERGRERCGRA